MNTPSQTDRRPPVGLAEFRERLLAGLLAGQPDEALMGAARRGDRTRGPRGRGWAPGRRIAGFAVVCVAVACAVLVATLTRSEPSAAAAVLNKAASRLDAAPGPALPAGSYWYIQTRERVLNMTSFEKDGEERTAAWFTDDLNDTWLANDGSGAEYGAIGKAFALTPAGRRVLGEFKPSDVQARTQGMVMDGPKLIAVSLGSKQLNPANLSALPSDERRLREVIASTPRNSSEPHTAHQRAVDEFEAIANALFYEPFDARVSAALYRVLAMLPDVQTAQPVDDALGRTGVAITIDAGSSRWGLIIDAATGKLLERTETKIASDANDALVPVGTVTWRQTISGTAIVPGVAIRPNGTRLPTDSWTVCKPDPQPGNPNQGHCVDP